MLDINVAFKFIKIVKLQYFKTMADSVEYDYRAMHFSANARSWDRTSSVHPSVRLSVCDVGGL